MFNQIINIKPSNLISKKQNNKSKDLLTNKIKIIKVIFI